MNEFHAISDWCFSLAVVQTMRGLLLKQPLGDLYPLLLDLDTPYKDCFTNWNQIPSADGVKSNLDFRYFVCVRSEQVGFCSQHAVGHFYRIRCSENLGIVCRDWGRLESR